MEHHATTKIDILFDRKTREARAALTAKGTASTVGNDDTIPFEVNKVLRQVNAHHTERAQKSLKAKSRKD